MTGAGKELEAFRLGCRLIERSCVRYRDDLVGLPVEHEERRPKVPDALVARVGVRNEKTGEERVVLDGGVAHARERRLKDKTARWDLEREVDRDRPAERLS